MSQYDDAGRSALALNTELHDAHLQLLSAHCATHQLRIRYSSEDLVRFGRHDLLSKSARAASELKQFYESLEKKFPQPAPVAATTVELSPEIITQAVGWLAGYLRAQRDHYLPIASPLPPPLKARLSPYFSPQLLDVIRLVELRGARVALPDFYSQVRAFGFEPPEITHMDSLTFLDVLAFNQELSERALFHAMVHAVQIRVLGLERYAELWVRSFIRTRVHYTVPLEVHAFSLSSRFFHPLERFSVENEVIQWTLDGRY